MLIFCSSRKGCESTARHVSRFLKSYLVSFQNDETEFGDITSAIAALRKCPAGLDPILEETLPLGVAYHHAGLTVFSYSLVISCFSIISFRYLDPRFLALVLVFDFPIKYFLVVTSF